MTDQRPRLPWALAAAVLIACVAAWPLLSGGGLVNTRGGGDSPFLLQRLHQLSTALEDGHFPVRWMPDANYGYGYPFFNYYAPFAFYVATLFRFLDFTIVQSIQLSQLSAFLAAAIGMYFLGKRWFGREMPALLASAAYTLAPFHLVNVYVRGDSIAEFWAMGWYPFVILATDRLFDEQIDKRRAIAELAIAYGGLLLSHNISAMIFSPFPLLYAAGRWLFEARDSKWAFNWRPIGALTAGLLIGMLISAWFWLPALQERTLTRISEVTVGYFDFNFGDGYHFRSTNLVQPTLIFDTDVDNGNAFRMGLVQALSIGAGLISLIAAGRRKTISSWVLFGSLASFALATFMITPASRILWNSLPLLPFTQFPWRFLSIQAFWGAALVGFIGLWLPENRWWGWATFSLLTGALMGTSLLDLNLDYLPLEDDDITAERLAEYEWFTTNIGTTIGAEYLAEAVNPRPFASPWLNTGERWTPIVTSGEARAFPIRTATHRHEWEFNVASDSAEIVLPIMFWPGWQASLGGDPLPISAANSSGLIQFDLPAGEHTVELALRRTAIRFWAEIGSVLGIGLILALYSAAGTRFNFEWQPPATIVGIVLIYFGIAQLSGPELPAADAPATWDFAQMGYLHRETDIRYGNGAILEGYTLSTETLTAGESLIVTLDWSDVPSDDIEREVELSLTTPTFNFYNFVPAAAVVQVPLTDGQTDITLTIPENAPAGLYAPKIALTDDNRVRTPAGIKRSRDLFLSPLLVESARTPIEATQPINLQLRSVTQRPDVRVFDIQVDWLTQTPLSTNYVVSWRLTDLNGLPLHSTQFDVQPFYGLQPSVGWQPGAPTADWFSYDLREPIQAEPPYILLASLYDTETGENVLLKRLGMLEPAGDDLVFVPHTPNFELPDDITLSDAILSDRSGSPLIALSGYRFEETEDQLIVTLYWEALANIPAEYTHFVHLIDPATGVPAVQHDTQPQQNTYPTSQWTVGEIIEDRAVLFLDGRDPAEFELMVGFYRQEGDAFPRLPAAENGQPLPNDAIRLR